MTGSYHNYFRIFDVNGPGDIVLQADKSAFKQKKMGQMKNAGMKNGMRPGGLKEQMNLETLDFNKKILHGSWHPRENTIAVSPSSSLFFLKKKHWLVRGLMRFLPFCLFRLRRRTIFSCTAQHSFSPFVNIGRRR